MVHSFPPHLIKRNGEKCCSVCKKVFTADSKPSVSKAFVEHVRNEHRPAPNPKEAVVLKKGKSIQIRRNLANF